MKNIRTRIDEIAAAIDAQSIADETNASRIMFLEGVIDECRARLAAVRGRDVDARQKRLDFTGREYEDE